MLLRKGHDLLLLWKAWVGRFPTNPVLQNYSFFLFFLWPKCERIVELRRLKFLDLTVALHFHLRHSIVCWILSIWVIRVVFVALVKLRHSQSLEIFIKTTEKITFLLVAGVNVLGFLLLLNVWDWWYRLATFGHIRLVRFGSNDDLFCVEVLLVLWTDLARVVLCWSKFRSGFLMGTALLSLFQRVLQLKSFKFFGETWTRVCQSFYDGVSCLFVIQFRRWESVSSLIRLIYFYIVTVRIYKFGIAVAIVNDF